MIKEILNSGESRMRGAIQVLQDDLAAVRLLDVDFDGAPDETGFDQRSRTTHIDDQAVRCIHAQSDRENDSGLRAGVESQ